MTSERSRDDGDDPSPPTAFPPLHAAMAMSGKEAHALRMPRLRPIATKLVIIGYPMGLPEKISPTGTVKDVSDPLLASPFSIRLRAATMRGQE